MRAICGAIITAGALIGLGLTSLGLGTRYASYYARTGPEGTVDFAASQLHFGALDNPLKLILILLVIGLIIGVCVAFLGLMYHHHRRHHESLLHAPRDGGATQRVL
jgi:hypothetical protein